ncbi:tRNA uridine-5-carboxymethylaminomethyl(34) synthesis GTPase MnmE [Sphingomonas sp. LY160]|uniref:tRNA uridine-5-carboxymethylaminomethyl(34) synthesis GTPase MnmE n=1 Tax=Sphingomonas sp. LY160 TaxID=3095342 RepID=UPI002ADEAEB2|nr:tRNA uridine-5-carboxymethylaminomethyl(34) synthesis GTPase MnmE [Sphingomonas sp. LY160]MEA1072413.1 tRNA uridine-5-carboxymethylaminomethyl(34) synthesis GTPase MnmE [Sphingomonas sp. LY160]
MVGQPPDTIVALSSGRPPAGISVIRSSGPHAFAAAERLIGRLPPARQASFCRLRDPEDHSLLDEAVVLRFDAPASSTGEDVVEYQCHGGRATIEAVLSALRSQPGFRLAEPGEFTRRALANGRIDLTEAEGLADLLSAETEWQRRSAVERAGGGLRRRLDEWRERLLVLSARAEVAIDYADEDDGAEDLTLGQDAVRLAAELREVLSGPRVEPLRDGIRVVIAGPPNSGKSSLVNALSQSEKAIVTPIAGTTRDVIEVPIALNGIPFVLIDTAGLHDTSDPVEAIGIERAGQQMEGANLVLWMGPACEHPPGAELISPKSDLDASLRSPGLPISVVTGEGLADLVALLSRKAMTLLPDADQIAVNTRQRELLGGCADALLRASDLNDPVLVSEELRHARSAIDRISGQAGVEDMLDRLFGQFCLGK